MFRHLGNEVSKDWAVPPDSELDVVNRAVWKKVDQRLCSAVRASLAVRLNGFPMCTQRIGHSPLDTLPAMLHTNGSEKGDGIEDWTLFEGSPMVPEDDHDDVVFERVVRLRNILQVLDDGLGKKDTKEHEFEHSRVTYLGVFG
ncbi:hypothetical protein D9758_010938 [Tetrapyrgos nigripes]|uniref:Uncharacterized protein n=1 Tax=Tetrapyrgos nigripes TaxID=182062 RepID=A0A8H5CWI3_9AGAR|nr:hypothetical protein D9758_010938 [Tetrapyrgos nigripes]